MKASRQFLSRLAIAGMAFLSALSIAGSGLAKPAKSQPAPGPVPNAGKPLPCVDTHGKVIGRAQALNGQFYFIGSDGKRTAIAPIPAAEYQLSGVPQLCLNMGGGVSGRTVEENGHWYYLGVNGTKWDLSKPSGSNGPHAGPEQATRRTIAVMPNSKLFAAYYLTDGHGNEEFVDTQGHVIGRMRARNGATFIVWSKDPKLALQPGHAK